MLKQTRETDLELFFTIAKQDIPVNLTDTPLSIAIPAFVTSELKTAFQIGFIIYIPFLVIDLVVASVLMAMGMIMLSPQMISLPFKLMLFVLVDGWAMIMGTMASSFFEQTLNNGRLNNQASFSIARSISSAFSRKNFILA